MSPRLSVALPVRNGADYLAAALDSILAQSFTDFELVVSDNASTDATPDILADYARRDPRVRPSRSAEPLSQVANCNRAVGLASGAWVKLFCHDDMMREDCLAKIDALIDQVDGSDVGLIGNGERHLFANGYMTAPAPEASPVRVAGPDMIAASLGGIHGRPSMPGLTTATVRRTAFDQSGGFDDRYILFDLFCWLELLARWSFAYVPASLTINRIHGRQVTVTARTTMRSVDDYRRFVGDYLDRRGEQVALTSGVRLRARLKPLTVAAMTLASELACGRWKVASAMMARLPPHWLPLVVPLVARAFGKERRRHRQLRGHVPNALIYP